MRPALMQPECYVALLRPRSPRSAAIGGLNSLAGELITARIPKIHCTRAGHAEREIIRTREESERKKRAKPAGRKGGEERTGGIPRENSRE